MDVQQQPDQPAPREGLVPVERAALYYREIGQGQPLIILHGGPDFDHNYLLPAMDRLSDVFRLIYYDQRGRGRSADQVQPDAVSIASELEDLDRIRAWFQLESVAVLGHSWGGLLAMEYALRYPERVSRLILMNSCPASHPDDVLVRQNLRRREPGAAAQLKALADSRGYAQGDPETVAAFYRLHFSRAIRQPEQLERLLQQLTREWTRAGILRARAIEERLFTETLLSSAYNLLPSLIGLSIPTLVLHGADDFIPVDCARRIAQAIPGARLVLLQDCGHFAYFECPDDVHAAVEDFLHRP